MQCGRGSIRRCGLQTIIGSKFLLRRGYVGLVLPQEEKLFENIDRNVDGKGAKPSSAQQSTTPIGWMLQGGGAQGSRRMAMAVGEMGDKGEGGW